MFVVQVLVVEVMAAVDALMTNVSYGGGWSGSSYQTRSFSSGNDTEGTTGGNAGHGYAKISPLVTVSVSDSGCGNDNLSYQYCISTTGSTCTPNIAGTGTSIDLNVSEPGTYKICTRATDGAGNSSGIVCSNTYNMTEPLIKAWSEDATTDFHGYKTTIKSITIVDHNDVPSNAYASWDVSAAGDGSVMAWIIRTYSVTRPSDALYIGGDGGVIANPNSTAIFRGFSSVTSIDLDLLDTSRVTNMRLMFDTNSALTSLDLSKLDTSNVTNMENIFGVLLALTSLDVSGFNTKNVTTMSGMFSASSSKLTNLDLSSFDTSNVTDMSYMFYGLNGLNRY